MDSPAETGRQAGHCLFGTAIGICGMAWGPAGITAVQLPEPSPEATRTRLLRSLSQAVPEHEPPPDIRAAIADLRHLVLDMSRLSAFHQRVYERTRAIAPGTTLSYGELAGQLGGRGLARAVGQAMGANPFAPVVPCHRVLAAGGRSGGFSATGGARTKLRLLEIEGYRPGGAPSLFDAAG